MKAKVFLSLGIGAAALVVGAMAWDATRTTSDALARVRNVDSELKKQETRFIVTLDRAPSKDSELVAALKAYERAADIGSRHKVFQDVVSAAHRKLIPALSSVDTAQRKVLDDLLGAVNRRDIAYKMYSDELNECEKTIQSAKGGIGGLIGAVPEACDKVN